MCILPNMPARDLEELSKRRKKQLKKTEVETVKVIIPECQSVENSI